MYFDNQNKEFTEKIPNQNSLAIRSDSQKDRTSLKHVEKWVNFSNCYYNPLPFLKAIKICFQQNSNLS